MSTSSLPAVPGVVITVNGPSSPELRDQFHRLLKHHAQERLNLSNGMFARLWYYGVEQDSSTQDLDDLFIGIGDVTGLDKFSSPEYAAMQKNTSEEEKKAFSEGLRAGSTRKVYQVFHKLISDNARDADTVPGALLVLTTAVIKKDDLAEYEEWIVKEHFPLINKVEGFRRARGLRPVLPDSSVEADQIEVCTVYEYEKENGLSGPKFKAVFEPEYTKTVRAKFISGVRRVGNFFQELK